MLLMASCVPKPNTCTQFVHNIYEQSITWKARFVKLNIDETVPKYLIPSIYRAANSWNKAIGREQIVITENISSKNNILYLSSWEVDRAHEQARTSIRWAGDEIISANIKVNSKNFIFYDIAPTLNGNKYSFEALMVHEMGHFLGLSHASFKSVMVKHLGAYENRINLHDEDIKQVQCEYK